MTPMRGDSEGSTYQIKSGPQVGKWRAAVVVGRKPNGQPDRRTAMRATENEAKKALRVLLNDRDAGRTRSAQPWKLGPWLDHWLRVTRRDDDLAVSTREQYEWLIGHWITPTIGTVKLSAVGESHAEKVQTAMREAGLSASARHQAHVVLHSALTGAVKAKLLGHNPIQHADAPAVPKVRIQQPTRQEVEAIFEACEGRRLGVRYVIALVNGTRQGETLGLEWPDVDTQKQAARVLHQLRRVRGRHGCGPKVKAVASAPKVGAMAWPCGRRWASKCTNPVDGKHGCGPRVSARPIEPAAGSMVYPCGTGWASKCPDGTPGGLYLLRLKSVKSRRTIGLTPYIADDLDDLRTLQKRERLLCGANYHLVFVHEKTGRLRVVKAGNPTGKALAGERELDLVFRSPDGRPIDPRQDWETWETILVAAGLGRTAQRLHNARHAAVSGMLDSGITLHVASDLVGHSSYAFTKDRYGHLSRESADAALDLMTAHQRTRLAMNRHSATVMRLDPTAE